MTLFVITADHTSSDILFEESFTAWGVYSVPVLYFRPDNSLAGIDSTITQQIDIMPSVLGYLDYPKPYIGYGRNIFENEQTPFAITIRATNCLKTTIYYCSMGKNLRLCIILKKINCCKKTG